MARDWLGTRPGLAWPPGLASLRAYDRTWLRGDVVAGVTVAAYLIPQVMAYAGMAGLPGELGGLGHRLQAALERGDWTSCQRLLRQFLDKYLRDFAASLDAGGVQAESEQLRDLLRQALGIALASLLQPLPALAGESSHLGDEIRQWQPGRELALATV